MKQSLKNCLSLNRKKKLLLIVSIVFFQSKAQQIINYVNNPGFEQTLPSATVSPYEAARYWGSIDTNNGATRLYSKTLGSAPYGFGGFQFPKSGNNFIGTFFYCDTSTCASSTRWYPRNRLKKTLKSNTVYCAKYHVVNTNNSVVGIDSYGLYCGNSDIDTITHCVTPLTYLYPQVQNSNGVITDTLNWTAITGTFTAIGTEKYLIIGNFKTNAATNTLIINPTYLPFLGSDILIDDVSLIELNLPAFAGNDTTFIPGDSVFIGREPDVGIDEACMWYKLPIILTPTTPAIDAVAGMWIHPTATSTYVVRQQLWCSSVKWDTVVVYIDAVGLEKLKLLNDELKIYPVPAKDKVELRLTNGNVFSEFNSLSIYNNLGQKIREEVLRQAQQPDGILTIKTDELANGAYFIILSNARNERVTKKLLIAK